MKTLAAIFNNVFFRVPDYQRGYAWETPQLEDFWKDLNWLREGHQHYTGMLTLHPLKPAPAEFPHNAPHTVYHLVDGQQRITTFFVLLSKLIGRTNNGTIAGQPVSIVSHNYISATINNKKFAIFGYDSQDKMDFLNTLLAQRTGITKKPEIILTKNIYEKNLLEASDFFDKKLNGLSIDDSDRLFTRLTTQLVFDVHEVKDTFDVCAMFESINYRGKKLTKFEVLKNRLMYLSELIGQTNPSLLEHAQSLRANIDSSWGIAFDWFGKGKEPLDEDDFLYQHTAMYFGALQKEREALDRKLFKNQFSIDRLAMAHANPLTLDELEAYVKSIKTSSELWAFQNACIVKLTANPSWLTQEVIDWTLRLTRLGMRHFKPLLLGALNQVASPNTSETGATLVELLKKMERFIFIVYGLCDYPANERSKSYFADYGWNIYSNDPEFSFERVVSDIDDYLYSYDDDGAFEGVFSNNRFIDKVHARFIGGKGWRDWNEIQYFLSEWENHFKNCSQAIMANDNYDYASVEHVMPQNPEAPGLWIQNQIDLKKRFKYVVQDLGNLTLLGVGANKAVQDIDLKSKAAAYQSTHDGKDIIRRAGKAFNWGENIILSRGSDMVKFMCERWQLPGQELDSELRFDSEDILSKNVKPPRQPRIRV